MAERVHAADQPQPLDANGQQPEAQAPQAPAEVKPTTGAATGPATAEATPAPSTSTEAHTAAETGGGTTDDTAADTVH